MLTSRGSQLERDFSGVRGSNIMPGRYYIANAQTGGLLQLASSEDNNQSRIRGTKAHFRNSQVWIFEQGKIGYIVKSLVSDAYIGHMGAGTPLGVSQAVGQDNATEFRVEGNNIDGFSFLVIGEQNTGVLLVLEDDSRISEGDLSVHFSADVGLLRQRWLLEEYHDLDVLNLYRGPIPTGQVLHIRGVTTGSPLELRSSWRNGISRLFTGNNVREWTIEPGFNGYYLKHCASGLYAFTEPKTQDINILPLTLGPAETEFIISGNSQDGYSITYALNPKYGLEIDQDTITSGAKAFVLWRLDGDHSKWQVETLTSS